MRLLNQRFGLFFLPMLLIGCGGSDGDSEPTVDPALDELRINLITGESEDVFESFWNCADESDGPGFLLSFWSTANTNAGNQVYDGAQVLKSTEADPYSIEWFPVSSKAVELTVTNLVQASVDETYQLTNVNFAEDRNAFTATDTRGSDIDCEYLNTGAAAYCQFWGSFKAVCGT